MENGADSEGRDPSGFLSKIISNPVTVKLNSGVVYKGKAREAGSVEIVDLLID
jgi:U6 snRNA-associated Sm-like protein LSm6